MGRPPDGHQRRRRVYRGARNHAARLRPLTDADADELIRSVSTAPLLLGRCGAPAADTGMLAGMMLCISRLADDLPELAELAINPVIAAPGGAFAVGPASGSPVLRPPIRSCVSYGEQTSAALCMRRPTRVTGATGGRLSGGVRLS